MKRSRRVNAALPALVLLLVVIAEVVSGRGQVVLGLSVIAPLASATFLGRRTTVAYAAAAFVVATLLGLYSQQYTAETAVAQTIRLIAVALGGALAVVTCQLRLRREAHVARLGAEAAATRAAVRTGETLQRALLGDIPTVPGLETTARYLPGAREAQVGGDWYDAFPLSDGRTMLVIGDVAGHDAPAAATMAQTRGMLRALARVGHGSPAAALTVLDDVLAGLGLETLVTVAVATIDPRGAVDGAVPLQWSNAGHPPPVVVRADGRVEVLERMPDRLLGAGPGDGPARTDHDLLLHRGDTLLLYTDGLVERRGMTLDDGTTWLVRTLRELGREPLDRMCDGLLSALGSRGDDDIALLVVRLPA
ncbi:Serine phosphatase RsbU, regulator of sigma subunit [Blastococcus sp. DSM 46786]|uniref:PP2C family protein-serine/threonine phosphatase n=1 Tax=Blastococcus sp. DSM 46786 TaxID=1798227 RepID=UPI0008BD8B55|nr:PP2C family protein-serine/threonine phosphatase [Blastococcus sp. DSM 46786]SEL94791.1 Serine phosphatase RsbU, regulator of sigma subunit [Blastococcus sp. DSM 46786]